MEFRVKSLRVEKFVNYNDRDRENEILERYILNCETGKGNNPEKWELSLWTEYGDCYSGWCAASWGYGAIKKVNQFVGMTHKPIKELLFKIDDTDLVSKDRLPDMDNDIFYLEYSDDYYYSSGSACVDMKLFEEINRSKELRPVWVFYGDSCLGKTYLAQIIGNADFYKTVYETDSNSELPEEITEDIVVLGNKYSFNIEDIDSKIKLPHELIKVGFNSKQ